MSLNTLLRRVTVAGACLLVTAAVLAVSAPTVSAANLLGNPGFEVPATPAAPPEYFGAGAVWTSFGGGIFTVSSVVAPPHSGNQSLKTFGGCCSGAYQEFPAIPGQTWNGGAWVMNCSCDPMGGGQVAAVNIEWHRADGSLSTIIPFISNGTFTAAQPRDQWTLQTITGVAPADAAFARFVVITGDFQPGGPAGAPFYDDAFFELAAGPTATKGSSWGHLKAIYR
jgi:hypothetical protein